MHGILHDVRYAMRQLRRSPGFTAVAVLTLALGIGANTAVFTLVQSVLLAPLQYKDASRIVALNTRWQQSGNQSPRVTGGDLADLRAQENSFEYFSYYDGGEMGVQLGDHATFTGVAEVNADFPRIFGVVPSFGRLFDRNEAPHSALVSTAFAEQNFGAPAAAVGRTISVEGVVYNIVGVTPASFSFPQDTRVWLGAPDQPGNVNRTAFNYHAVAKLKAGVTLGMAQAQLETIAKRLSVAYPTSNEGKSFAAVPLQEQMVGQVRPALLLLMAAVGLILLIACVNVAHLQLARATTRVREMAVRAALGASRWQVARQILVEGFWLSLAGGVVGVLLAVPAIHGLLRLAPANLPRLDEVHLDGRVLAFTCGLCLLATLLAGLAPAWQLWRANLNDALKQDASRGMSGHGAPRLRAALVVAEVSLTFMLAAAAGLLARTMIYLATTEMGFQSDNALVMYAHAPAHGLNEYLQKTQTFENLYGELAALPGVKSVAGVMGLPTGQYGSNGAYLLEGQSFDAPPQSLAQSNFTLTSPGYFRTMGIPMLRGRDFNASDSYNGERVAIVSEALAKKSFPDADPIGHKILCGLDAPLKWMTIVGVVGDVRQSSPASRPGPTLYMPLTQHPYYANEIQIVMRTQVPPLTLMNAVQAKVTAADPSIATKFTTMDAMVGQSMAAPRFRALLIATFAGLGLLLAMLGVYGVMAYTVAQRSFEVGIRMSFGAMPQDILGMVVKQALRLAVMGIAVGLVMSAAAVKMMSTMLVGVRAEDPVTFALACVLLLVTAMAAAYIPARRAARVDPMTALRYE